MENENFLFPSLLPSINLNPIKQAGRVSFFFFNNNLDNKSIVHFISFPFVYFPVIRRCPPNAPSKRARITRIQPAASTTHAHRRTSTPPDGGACISSSAFSCVWLLPPNPFKFSDSYFYDCSLRNKTKGKTERGGEDCRSLSLSRVAIFLLSRRVLPNQSFSLR